MKNHLRGNVLSANCPTRHILQHICSRWGGLVLIVLKEGTKRYSELKREIEGISERMLAQTLKQLESDHLIIRQSFNTVPPHVEYRLTPLGKEAAEKVSELVKWLEDNLTDILANQQKNKIA